MPKVALGTVLPLVFWCNSFSWAGSTLIPSPNASVSPSEACRATDTARVLSAKVPLEETGTVDTMAVFEHDLFDNRLTAWHPNYLVIASDHGESRIQFLLSMKYKLLEFPPQLWNSRWAYQPNGLYVAYDGLYDFYWLSRPSSPVISRIQNPGGYMHLTPRNQERMLHVDYLDAGWFHESNGQTTVNETQYKQLYAEEGQDVQDSVHRGWDYWYLGSRLTYLPFDDPEIGSADTVTKLHQLFAFMPSLRLYDGHQGFDGTVSENVFWKRVAFQPYIYDYDGIRASFSWTMIFPDTPILHINLLSLGADFRTGYNSGYFATNWSKTVTLTVKTAYFPWYVYYFNGYGPYISDYSTWSEGWGMGLRLW